MHRGFEYRDLKADELAQLAELHSGFQSYYKRVGPKGYILHNEYKKLESDILNMPLRPDDVFVTSYQRSGTTLTQELVWLLANNLDYEKAAAIPLVARYPCFEFEMMINDVAKERTIKMNANMEQTRQAMEKLSISAIKVLAETPSPRFVKTHLPISFLPPGLLDNAKVVYVARDPRDVVVSNFHLAKLLFPMSNFTGDFKQTWNAFKNNLFIETPYFEHVKKAWALRHHKNMLFLFYEDLSKDLPGSIRRVAEFLGKELTQPQIERLCDHLNIENFRNNKSVNFEYLRESGVLSPDETFIRKGKSGGWREYFDEEMTRQAEQWIRDNLRETDLRYPSMENDSEINL